MVASSKTLGELKDDIRKEKETDLIVVGYFNKDLCSKNIQGFVVEMGLYDAFREVHDVEKKAGMVHLSMGQSTKMLC